MKIKKGDHVIVISGKDKGKSGSVVHAFPKTEMVVVEGINIMTKHQKSRTRGSQGQIIKKPMPIHVSNVGLKDGKTDKPGRIGYNVEGEGKDAKKVRVVRPSGEKA
ncbi:50S ribosomal protein L24 [Candidatus Parcubacteria bacterium]|uniref:Large ribosomal subunit protein uL24 n=1 Tax=Candidatus Kaiserbacteria bacterium CG10_big_fil_rev_8_21_14_0_10_47_16 TaxID=1974608 RepID=A0A2H0UDU9_9BACT|nr:50S ribosomal protein L24 [Candidatus Parcubacteria bacterium]PIR84530.1 MAG: 50S ribosomal protein L24 [Candidatus Kaiserbacteria bacterium CG10_big_fil_rev_8_21_14_0_10_47_16]